MRRAGDRNQGLDQSWFSLRLDSLIHTAASARCRHRTLLRRNRFNGFTGRIPRKPLKRLHGSKRLLIHRAEAAM